MHHPAFTHQGMEEELGQSGRHVRISEEPKKACSPAGTTGDVETQSSEVEESSEKGETEQRGQAMRI